MASKQLTFYEQFQQVTVVCNGVPLALNAEVSILLKRPAKLDSVSRRAWDQLTAESAQYASVALVAKGKEE